MRHLRIVWTLCSREECSAVREILAEIVRHPALCKITLVIDIAGDDVEGAAGALEKDIYVFSLLEALLLKLPSLKTVTLVFTIGVAGPPSWYRDFVDTHGPRIFPALHSQGVLELDPPPS